MSSQAMPAKPASAAPVLLFTPPKGLACIVASSSPAWASWVPLLSVMKILWPAVGARTNNEKIEMEVTAGEGLFARVISNRSRIGVSVSNTFTFDDGGGGASY